MKTTTLFLLFVALSNFALAEENPVKSGIKQYDGNLRFTYDPVLLPGNEPMGLVGVNYLLDITPMLYAGVAGYGAVTGQRGGFFTGGFEAGMRKQFTHRWYVDTGLFVGGGGGGGAPQGGGLMLRPHANLIYDLGGHRLGFGYSWVKYPNGTIDSNQLTVLWEKPLSLLTADGHLRGRRVDAANLPSNIRDRASLVATDYRVTVRSYYPKSGSRDTAGQALTARTDLVGMQLRRKAANNRYYTLEAAGAAGGITDGYAEILFGIGYRLPITDNHRFAVTASLAAGAAGGGKVNTGGGAIVRAEAGLDYHLTSRLMAGLNTGYMTAPGGQYDARSWALRFGYTLHALTLGGKGRSLSGTEQVEFLGWRIRVAHQSYLSPAWKDAPLAARVDLLGLKVDFELSDRYYLSGQALGAYGGGAGGYAVGLLGVGWQSRPVFGKHTQLTTELNVGASGGGTIDVGGGAIGQVMFGVSYDFSDKLAAEFSLGRVKALGGTLDSSVIDFGLVYRISTLGARD